MHSTDPLANLPVLVDIDLLKELTYKILVERVGFAFFLLISSRKSCLISITIAMRLNIFFRIIEGEATII